MYSRQHKRNKWLRVKKSSSNAVNSAQLKRKYQNVFIKMVHSQSQCNHRAGCNKKGHVMWSFSYLNLRLKQLRMLHIIGLIVGQIMATLLLYDVGSRHRYLQSQSSPSIYLSFHGTHANAQHLHR
ncbi:MAG: hypothetical protein ACI8PW_000760 [Methylophilaceae bacterium]|jgi:hypothetical protein